MAIELDISDLIQKLQDRADRAAAKASTQTAEEVQKKLRQASDIAIDRWYSEYPPQYYGRSGALKSYDILDDGYGIVVDFEQQIATHQRNNDLILELVVGQGFHGGSPGKGADGVMYRTGPNFCRWGDPAEQSGQPIIQEINKKVAELNSNFTSRATELLAENFISG